MFIARRIVVLLAERLHVYDYLVAGYALFAVILALLVGFKLDFSVIFQFQYDKTFLAIVALYFVIHVAVMALTLRKQKKDDCLFGSVWRREVSERYLRWSVAMDIVRVLVLLKVTLMIYCEIKQAIPFINPRLYDAELRTVDQWTHLGINPNTAVVALLGAPALAFLFDKLYVLWYLLKPLTLAYFAVTPDRKLHSAFFSAYFAMWIFGGLIAVSLPSLGPIYTHPEWFAGLNARIARSLQTRLMTHYQSALSHPEQYKVFIYEGIAAFPSLHVGIAALFAFFAYSVNRKVGYAFATYAVIVQIGSVLLGWHYAVDGYFATLLAYAFFRMATGRLEVVKPLPNGFARSETVTRNDFRP